MFVSIFREDLLVIEKLINLYFKWSDIMLFVLLVFWYNIIKVVIVVVVMSCLYELFRGVLILKN